MMRRYLTAGFATLWILIVAYKLFNPAEADGKRFFGQLSAANVESVEFESRDSVDRSVHTIKVIERRKLDEFFAAWRGADTIMANHPKYLWAIRVRFNTSKGVYAGALGGTSNQGVLFTFDRSPWGWPVSACYQLVGSPERMDRVLQDVLTADSSR
jgi:hypothetical protein